MLNIIDLENRWKRYKIKSYIPYITIVVSLSIIIGIILFFISTKHHTPTKQKISQSKIIAKPKPTRQQSKPTTPQLKPTPPHKIKEKTLLMPSMEFLKNMQDAQPYYIDEIPKQKKIIHKKVIQQEIPTEEILIKPKLTKPKPIQLNKNSIETHTEKPKKISITINQERDPKKDIKEVLKRFKENNNPALSLFIAKNYYELKEYKQAYNYALITNQLDNTIEDSWLIFAKSLVKMGQKDKAIEILKKHISDSNSNSAQILYENIRTGKFK